MKGKVYFSDGTTKPIVGYAIYSDYDVEFWTEDGHYEHYGVYQEDIYGDAWFVVCKLPDEKIAKFKNKLAALNECKYLERLEAKKRMSNE